MRQAQTLLNSVGMNKAFRDDFPGSALDADLWQVVQTGAGMTITVGSSNLTIATGTTSGSETIIKSLMTFSIPCRLQCALSISQRIANQEFYLEVIDAAGNQYARWMFDGTTATTDKTETKNTDTSNGPTARSSVLTTASSSIFTIDLTCDEVIFESRYNDAIVLQNAVFSHTLKIPSPNDDYFIQIRAKNTAAAGSTTNFVFDHVGMVDTNTVFCEINGGRGGFSANRSIAVNVGNTVSVQGISANDAVVPTYPFTIAGEARTTNAVVSASGDTARIITDLTRRPIIALGHVPELNLRNRQVLTGASETTLIGAVGSVRHEIWDVVVANLSAANVVQVDFRDATGGTIMFTVSIPVSQTVVCTLSGWPASAVNANWTVQATGTSPNVAVSARSVQLGA